MGLRVDSDAEVRSRLAFLSIKGQIIPSKINSNICNRGS